MTSRDALAAARDALDAAAGARAREYWSAIRAHFTAVRAGASDDARGSRVSLDVLALEIFGTDAPGVFRAHQAFIEHLYGMLRAAKAKAKGPSRPRTPDVNARKRVGMLEASGDVAPSPETTTATRAGGEPSTSAASVPVPVTHIAPHGPLVSSAPTAPRTKRARTMTAHPKSSTAKAVKSASTSFGLPLGAIASDSRVRSGLYSVDRLQARARVMNRELAASMRIREDVVDVLRAATASRVRAVARAALDASRDALSDSQDRFVRRRRAWMLDFIISSASTNDGMRGVDPFGAYLGIASRP